MTREEQKPEVSAAGPARAIRSAISYTDDHLWIRYAAGAAVLLMTVGLSAAVIGNIRAGDQADTSSDLLSYIGLALVSFTACAVPIPGIAAVLYALVIYCGFALNPLVVVVVGGLAMALGEGVGYLLGALGVRIAADHADRPADGESDGGGIRRLIRRLSSHVDEWMEKRGFITLLVLAAVPNPIVAFANITAGSTGMPFGKFYAAVAIGKMIRCVVLAGIGVWLRTVV